MQFYNLYEVSSINQRDVDVMMDDKLFVNIGVYAVYYLHIWAATEVNLENYRIIKIILNWGIFPHDCFT